jgi:hypothetical protein
MERWFLCSLSCGELNWFANPNEILWSNDEYSIRLEEEATKSGLFGLWIFNVCRVWKEKKNPFSLIKFFLLFRKQKCTFVDSLKRLELKPKKRLIKGFRDLLRKFQCACCGEFRIRRVWKSRKKIFLKLLTCSKTWCCKFNYSNKNVQRKSVKKSSKRKFVEVHCADSSTKRNILHSFSLFAAETFGGIK